MRHDKTGGNDTRNRRKVHILWMTRALGHCPRAPGPRAPRPGPETHHGSWRRQKSIAPDPGPIRRPPRMVFAAGRACTSGPHGVD